MQHVIHRSGNVDVLRYVVPDQLERRVLHQVPYVAFGPGDQIVDAQHFPITLDQVVAKVRSQKSRTTGNHCAQSVASLIPALLNPVLRPASIVVCPLQFAITPLPPLTLTGNTPKRCYPEAIHSEGSAAEFSPPFSILSVFTSRTFDSPC